MSTDTTAVKTAVEMPTQTNGGVAHISQRNEGAPPSHRHEQAPTLMWLLLDYFPLGAQSTLALSILLGLYWPGFVSSTSVTVVCALLIATTLGHFRIRLSWKALFANVIVALSVVAPAAISAIAGTDIRYSVEIALVFCLFPLIVSTIVSSALASKPDSVVPGLIWLVVAVISWMASAFLTNPTAEGNIVTEFRIGMGANPQGLTLDLVYSSLACIPYVTRWRARIGLVVITGIMIFAAASRGALVGYVAALVVYALIAKPARTTVPRRRMRSPSSPTLTLLAVGIGSAFVALIAAGTSINVLRLKLHAVWLMGLSRWSFLGTALRSGTVLDIGRYQVLQEAWSVFRAHPTFGLFGYEGASGTYAHNLLAGTLSEQGLVGAFSICICFAVVLYGALGPHGSAYRSRRCLVAVLWFVASAVNGLVVGTLLSNTALWVAVGILVGWPRLSGSKPIRLLPKSSTNSALNGLGHDMTGLTEGQDLC